MALRVLLADESSTIKKVFQLALQDFAVDVRPVNIGVDVLKVVKSVKGLSKSGESRETAT